MASSQNKGETSNSTPSRPSPRCAKSPRWIVQPSPPNYKASRPAENLRVTTMICYDQVPKVTTDKSSSLPDLTLQPMTRHNQFFQSAPFWENVGSLQYSGQAWHMVAENIGTHFFQLGKWRWNAQLSTPAQLSVYQTIQTLQI